MTSRTSWLACGGRTATLFLLFLATAVAEPQSAIGVIEQAADEWDAQQSLLQIYPDSDAPIGSTDSPFANLPSRLAEALLDPQIVSGSFSGESNAMTFTANLQFVANSSFPTLVGELEETLGSQEGSGDTVCISGPGEKQQRLVLSSPAQTVLLRAVGVNESTLASIEQVSATIEGRLWVLSPSRLGEALYDVLAQSAKDEDERVTLLLDPPPQWEPVRLSVKTVAGERVTIPVELDGASQQIEIAEDAYWRIHGTPITIPFNPDLRSHGVFLRMLAARGAVVFENLQYAVRFPVSKTNSGQASTGSTDYSTGSTDYEIHILGDRDTWFGFATISVAGHLVAQRGQGECTLNLSVASRGDDTVTLGPLPKSAWDRVTDLRIVKVGEEDVSFGYLDPPTCSTSEGGISGEAFDHLVALPDECQDICATSAEAAKGIPLAPVTTDRLDIAFSADECVSACLSSTEYRQCMNIRVIAGDQSRLGSREGLQFCQDKLVLGWKGKEPQSSLEDVATTTVPGTKATPDSNQTCLEAVHYSEVSLSASPSFSLKGTAARDFFKHGCQFELVIDDSGTVVTGNPIKKKCPDSVASEIQRNLGSYQFNAYQCEGRAAKVSFIYPFPELK